MGSARGKRALPASMDSKEGSQTPDVRVSAAYGDSCDIFPRPTTAINISPALDVQARLSCWRNADQTSLLSIGWVFDSSNLIILFQVVRLNNLDSVNPFAKSTVK